MLPGVGPYTAAAVRNFAFGEDVLPRDVNVERVLRRTRRGVLAARPRRRSWTSARRSASPGSHAAARVRSPATCPSRGTRDEPARKQSRFEGSFRQRRARRPPSSRDASQRRSRASTTEVVERARARRARRRPTPVSSLSRRCDSKRRDTPSSGSQRPSSYPGGALRIARQAVVRDLLPAGRVRDEGPRLRTDPRIAVDRAEPDTGVVARARLAAEERRAAPYAEHLLATAFGRPASQLLLALHDPHRAGLRARVRRRRRPGAPLAARAVAVPGRQERLDDLEADGAAAAASGDRLVHGSSVREACARRTRARLARPCSENRAVDDDGNGLHRHLPRTHRRVDGAPASEGLGERRRPSRSPCARPRAACSRSARARCRRRSAARRRRS